METSHLPSFSYKNLLSNQWFLTNIANILNSCDLASSFKFLLIISQTHCIISLSNQPYTASGSTHTPSQSTCLS